VTSNVLGRSETKAGDLLLLHPLVMRRGAVDLEIQRVHHVAPKHEKDCHSFASSEESEGKI